ncbi:MAG: hypothetical protein AAF696_11010 [Bacteroidota bacterium]
MKNTISFVLCFAFCVFPFSVWAQVENPEQTQHLLPQILPPSPTAASLGEYGEVPVGYYTGVPNISIPLYQAAGRQLSVPISLSYHASGIRVDQMASWVGLGWSLNAGGVISRTVHGFEDERSGTGYWSVGENIPDIPSFYGWTPTEQTSQLVSDGQWDMQADMYSYNFMGQSGKFVISHDGEVICLPHNNLKIEFDPLENSEFTITDPNGIRYEFSNREETTYLSETSGGAYTSAWYLTEVRSADGKDIINFSYTSSVITQPVRMSETDYYLAPGGTCDSKSPVYSTSINTVSSIYLSEIQTSRETIKFFSSNDRKDILNDHRLQRMEVWRNGQMMQETQFSTSYFTGGLGSTSPIYNGTAGDFSKRLRLDEVQTTGYDGTTSPPHVFNYDNSQLPKIGSFGMDHWGYYNGENTNTTLLPQSIKPGGVIWPGADREPNPSFAKAGILTRITYPTGGYSEFEYEGHDRSVGTNIEAVGGLRIKKIINHDKVDAANDIVREFVYRNKNNPSQSTGLIQSVPIYEYDSHDLKIVSSSLIITNCLYRSRSASPRGASAFSQGSHIVYKSVSELNGIGGSGGKSIYYYTFNLDPVILQPPFPPSTSYDHRRGLLSRTEIYDASDNLLESTHQTYTITNKQEIPGITISYRLNYPFGPNADEFDYGKYSIVSEWVYQSEMRHTLYDSPDDSLSTTTTYSYDNPNHLLLTSTEVINSNLRRQIVKRKYPMDYAPSTPMGSNLSIQDLLDQHMIAPVIEEQIWEGPSNTNPSLIKGSVNTYANWSGSGTEKVIYPEAVYLLETEAPIGKNTFGQKEFFNSGTGLYHKVIPDAGPNFWYKKRLNFTYGTHGELRTSGLQHDENSAYIWNEGLDLPLAQCTNAASNQIAFTSFETDGPGTMNFEDGGWQIERNDLAGFTQSPDDVRSGSRGFNIKSGRRLRKNGLPSGEYIVSFWYKSGKVRLRVGNSFVADSHSGSTSPSQLSYFEAKISINSGQPLRLISNQGNTIIDEVRLYPVNGQMTSYCYDAFDRVQTITDINNTSQHAEYDGLGRLIWLKDQEGNYLQRIHYNFSN